MNYYNENDPFAAQWFRELIKAGHIADGEVDERSIIDVKADDLRGFTQCHFFAGIGVWSHALRQAGWPDDRPVWTGSCPCQPFSVAGKGEGTADDRHLWPEFYRLIKERQPDTVFGEQVAGKAGEGWFDNVQADMERENYACGAVTFPACSIGSPHQRQRLYWMADSASSRRQYEPCEESTKIQSEEVGERAVNDLCGRSASTNWMANANRDRCTARGEIRPVCEESNAEHGRAVGRMADTDGQRSQEQPGRREQSERLTENDGTIVPGPTNGFWGAADWLFCRDGKWRPVEPGTFPLANGVAKRVGLLRGYGNAIVAPQAQIFIETVMEYLQCY